jgi:tetratricopeptide (TPR) repeat protein
MPAVNARAWLDVKTLFMQAMDRPTAVRSKWLRNLQITNEEIIPEVKRLLLHADDTSLPSGSGAPARTASEAELPHICSAGQTLAGRFEIEGFLGRGGMGEVYAARDHELGTQVAIKVLRAEYASQPAFIHQLKKEVHIARRLNNPHLCRVHDLHRLSLEGAGETIGLSMELLRGQTLSQRLLSGPLEYDEALRILKEIASGIDAAHSENILHRDLKCSNVILVETGSHPRAVITDFGLAREMRRLMETQTLFGDHAFAGTPAYMSPEQLLGKELTGAADIYSFGVIAFEVLSARLPFEGETALAIALRRLQETAPSLRRFRIGVPRAWDVAVRKCLDSNPEARPQNATAFVNLLESGDCSLWDSVVSRRAVMASATVLLGGAAVYLWPSVHEPPAEAAASVKRGEEFVRRRTEEGIANAIQEFRRATSIDPNYARAWAGLADAYVAALHYDFLDPKLARAEAQRAANTALKLDRHIGKAVGALAYVQAVDLAKWRSAEPLFRQAIKLQPKEALTHAWYAAYLGRLGRFNEALAEARQAVQIEPASFYCNHQLAAELFRARRFDDYFRQATELARLQPFEASSYLTLARACEWLGRYDQALRYCDQGEKYGESLSAACYRATIEAARGNRVAATQIAGRLEALGPSTPLEPSVVTHVFARLQDFDKVMSIIDEAVRREDGSVLVCPTDPYLDGLRNWPPYQAFLHKLGFSAA